MRFPVSFGHVLGRIAILRSTDTVCIIGLQRVASLSIMSYDLVMIIVLTALFVWPLFQGIVGPRLRKVAARTLVSVKAFTVPHDR